MEERDPQISALWRAAEHPEPPAGLDSRILAAARQAVVRPKPRRQGWWRLAMPFSAAAVLVLAVTLLLRVEQEHPDRLRDASPPAVREAPAVRQAPAEAETQAFRPSIETKAKPDQKSTTVPPAESGPMADRSSSPAAGSAAEAAPFPAASTAREADQAVGQTDTLAVPAAPAAAMRQEATPRAGNLELGKAKAERSAGSDPEHAVERIRQLLREGQREEALQVLAELRRQHPGFELPPDLGSLR